MKRSAPAVGQTVHRFGAIDVPEGEGRSATFIASEEKVDRYGDIITAAGWDLSNFKNNPVLLWGHKSSEPPIGKVPNIYIDGTQLKADTEFMTADLNAFADSIWKMVKAKYIRAVSVGFKVLVPPEPIFDANKILTGFKYIGQELLELSVCSVPALPTALNIAKSLHVPEGDIKRMFDGASAIHDMRSRELDFLKMRV